MKSKNETIPKIIQAIHGGETLTLRRRRSMDGFTAILAEKDSRNFRSYNGETVQEALFALERSL